MKQILIDAEENIRLNNFPQITINCKANIDSAKVTALKTERQYLSDIDARFRAEYGFFNSHANEICKHLDFLIDKIDEQINFIEKNIK